MMLLKSECHEITATANNCLAIHGENPIGVRDVKWIHEIALLIKVLAVELEE